MKRIGLLIDSLIGGGAERVVLNFAERFAALGHDVHVILVKREIEHRLEPHGYALHALSEDGVLAKSRALNKLLLARRLRRLVRGIEADGTRFDFFISNAEDSDRISRLARLPNVYVRYRNSLVQYLESKLGTKTGLKRAIRRWRWTRKFRRIYGGRHIVTVSDALQREILEAVGIRPRSIATIYNPFNFERLRALAAEPAPVPAAPYIVYAAKFENRKRQDVLIRAYAQLEVPHKLVLIGGVYTESDRAWLGEMRRLVATLGFEGHVLMPGFQSNPYPWIRRAALFAMSSDSEGLPTVLIESLILGTPVVSTDCPTGPSEILTGPLARFLSPPGDAAALARNMKAALESYPPIGDAMLERFRAEYAVERYLEHCSARTAKGNR
ncbi:MAG: glycosyltransferase [Betaproteobacteria bacterium]|nr:glycosyltransferase [Betaproteobacteria bacterium]